MWKPASNQEALSPILYLKMDDPTQPGKNLGTGGDFSLTGVVARSGRGPNQFNAPYSDLDGAADYLSRTSLAGAVDSKQVTVSFCFNTYLLSLQYIISTGTTQQSYRIQASIDASGNIRFILRNAAGTVLLSSQFPVALKAGRNNHFVVSLDLSDINKRAAYFNGALVSIGWGAGYVDDFADTTTPINNIGAQMDGGSKFNGRLGNVFFDTRYIDLSQPANLAKFVTGTGIDAKPVDLGANGEKPFGTPPLIYLPMYGNNAGKNYGTGGDFTVNSGPFPGARGPNEFWGNKADFNETTYAHLYRSNPLAGIEDKKTLSFSFFLQPDVANVRHCLLRCDQGSSGVLLEVSRLLENRVMVKALDASGILLEFYTANIVTAGLFHICLSIDLSDTAKRACFINEVRSEYLWATYVNRTMTLSSGAPIAIGLTASGAAAPLDGKLSEFYFTTDYIDFSQEANRLKFRDAFGNPVDLTPQIEAGEIPNPAIYMRFDPANFGKNSGTGGDFTVNGTITDAGQL